MDMTTSIPRDEYPRPALVRGEDSWVCLNGKWAFAFDFGKSGRERGMIDGGDYPLTITVPFAPESKLSGIEYTDFIAAVWYRRSFAVPQGFSAAESRLLIRFGAVDYRAEVWINGKSAGTHRGGYTPFAFDITDLVTEGENVVTVCAEDDTRDPMIPSGKQCPARENIGCMYDRTTGIWQTVWLEVVPRTYVRSLRMTPDVDGEKLDVTVFLAGDRDVSEISAFASLDGEAVSSVAVPAEGTVVRLTVPVPSPKLWDLGKPVLYDLMLTAGADRVLTYFGMRKVALDDRAFRLNGRRVFQRMVLDQGFWPDGIYTAPSDDELRADVERAMAVGFNGARMHMTIFEPRYLYWADRLGYMVWGEYPNWGLDDREPGALLAMLPEWLEEMERDYNSPALIGWCPFNETNQEKNAEFLAAVYTATKAIDPYRPVIDTSGNTHCGVTDVYDVHDYEQKPEVLRANLAEMTDPTKPWHNSLNPVSYEHDRPLFISEYGGTRWLIDADPNDPAWGYGDAPRSLEEYYARLKGLTDAMLDCPEVMGFCFTQLTDVFQEKNGIYAFDRREKFDRETIRAIFSRPAAIEAEEQKK